MRKFPIHIQHDAMLCGNTCLQMIAEYYGQKYSSEQMEKICPVTAEGVSMLAICRAAEQIGLHAICGRIAIKDLIDIQMPSILHWNQNHFVVLFKVKRKKNGSFIFYIADPSKGIIKYGMEDFTDNWVCTRSKDIDKGVIMILTKTPSFGIKKINKEGDNRSFKFLLTYVKQYYRYFGQILLGLLLGCLFQFILPFLTQAIVDIGIAKKDISFIYLVLLGQFVLVFSRSIVDFIRRWLLLYIGVRINISLISDFLAKLFGLPMPFFDTKQVGDLLQRMSDHTRIQSFLTTQTLSILFSLVSLFIFSFVLLFYNSTIFFCFYNF